MILKNPFVAIKAKISSGKHEVLQLCKICNGVTEPFQTAYNKFWHRCPECDFLQAEITRKIFEQLNKGEGLAAGTGPGGGGFREYWIAELLRNELGLSKVLLYGTGNTPTFQKLHGMGVDVWGCDISNSLVASRSKSYGKRFFHAAELPSEQFDAIVAVEVFEHLMTPLKTLKTLSAHLTDDGIIAGTTDFYEGGDIADHVYIKSQWHISYWSKKSISIAANSIGRKAALFKLECPGSVYPDEKFGLLWPRKRVFFLFRDKHAEFFRNLSNRHEVLPINRP